MLATLLVGGVVCTALSMAGTLVTEFKLGYWLGATRAKIQWSAIIASLLASAAVHGHDHDPGQHARLRGDGDQKSILPAPQANMMGHRPAELPGYGRTSSLDPVRYGRGDLRDPGHARRKPSGFALGMYLPMEINTSILLGAFVAWLVGKGAKDETVAKARNEKGILVLRASSPVRPSSRCC